MPDPDRGQIVQAHVVLATGHAAGDATEDSLDPAPGRRCLRAAFAREKSLSFPGCDLPGVYGAGAFQTLVNRDLVRPSEKLFIVGGGNVGLIAGYHGLQAGIDVVGLVEAFREGERSPAEELEAAFAEMDGYEATKLIKKEKPTLPVIAQTAYAFSDDRDKIHKAGFNDYISKPISNDLLYKKIAAFLERYPPEASIITYCSGRTCLDSHHLAEFLLEFGYDKVTVFIDGFPGWEAEGHPIE